MKEKRSFLYFFFFVVVNFRGPIIPNYTRTLQHFTNILPKRRQRCSFYTTHFNFIYAAAITIRNPLPGRVKVIWKPAENATYAKLSRPLIFRSCGTPSYSRYSIRRTNTFCCRSGPFRNPWRVTIQHQYLRPSCLQYYKLLQRSSAIFKSEYVCQFTTYFRVAVYLIQFLFYSFAGRTQPFELLEVLSGIQYIW